MLLFRIMVLLQSLLNETFWNLIIYGMPPKTVSGREWGRVDLTRPVLLRLLVPTLLKIRAYYPTVTAKKDIPLIFCVGFNFLHFEGSYVVSLFLNIFEKTRTGRKYLKNFGFAER